MASQAASPTPSATPRAPPSVPQPAPPPTGLVVARWTYVDEHHTHEVHAGVRPGAKPAFVVKGSAFQNDRADEVVEQVFPIEVAVGRAAHPGWRALVPPQGFRRSTCARSL